MMNFSVENFSCFFFSFDPLLEKISERTCVSSRACCGLRRGTVEQWLGKGARGCGKEALFHIH